MPLFGSSHPETSITIKVNQICENRNSEIEDIELHLSDLIALVEVQRLSGATECARAIRKKIKYGYHDEQLRALALLEMITLNGGPQIAPAISKDYKLIDLLGSIIRGRLTGGAGVPYHKLVVVKAINLAIGWKEEFKDLPDYQAMAQLYKAIPKNIRKSDSPKERYEEIDLDRSNADLLEPEEPFSNRASSSAFASGSGSGTRNAKSANSRNDDEDDYQAVKRLLKEQKAQKKKERKEKYAQQLQPLGSNTNGKKRKKKGIVYADEEYGIPQINYTVEAPRIRALIADSQTHSTALNNALLSIPAGESPLDDSKCAKEFEKCRSLRRKVLRYLQFVGAGDSSHKTKEVLAMDEEFLGSLLEANEKFIVTFKKFDVACGNPSQDYDQEEEDSDSSWDSYYSDSESEASTAEASSRMEALDIKPKKVPPPRPSKSSKLYDTFPLQTQKTPVDDSNPFGDFNAVADSSR